MAQTTFREEDVARLISLIRDVPDFPEAGIVFRDVTPLLADAKGLELAISMLAKSVGEGTEYIASVDARGFIMGTPVAAELGLGFVPFRKPGKLPYKTYTEEYDLEYGTNKIQIHVDAFPKDAKVWIIDDLIATGGTLAAACELVERVGGKVTGISVLIELTQLRGRDKLPEHQITSLLKF